MNISTHPPSNRSINPEHIRIYCGIVFGYLEGIVPVRYLSEKGTPYKSIQSQFLTIDALADRLVAVAQLAADNQRAVFVVPGTVAQSGSARAEDIIQTGVLLVDLDNGDIAKKRAHLVHHLGIASLEVASGGQTPDGQPKLHLYWRLTEPAKGADLIRVAELRSAIAEKIGGDTSFGSLHQPVRVAGTIHGKHGIKSAVRITAQSRIEYDLTDLSEVVASMPELEGNFRRIDTGPTGTARPTARRLARMRVRENGADGITRFEALSKVMGHWIRNVRLGTCTLEEARQAVSEHNAALIAPPWDEERLTLEFDRLLNRDIVNHGSISPSIPPDPRASAEHDTCPPALSDDALAATFVYARGHLWRYVPVWRAWLYWDGKVWVRDQTGLVREQMRLVCRSACTDLKPNDARRVASDKTITAALKLVGTDPRIATAPVDWDQHRMLLNTQSGVVDLESGELCPHDPALLITQISAASVGSGCPRWTTFLKEITNGDLELETYLQRFAGYALTGVTTEQAFVFFHGQGANGKSVYLSILAEVLGGYAATATLDTFTSSRSPRHLTELAGLKAARLVLVPETEAGQAWAEARLKAVTGGEKVRANFMHQDHFEFLPQFKLLVAGNHRPSLSNVGEAMRRRLHLVPFRVTIPPDRRDPRLVETLKAELDGILGWMIAGCADWRGIGLAPPQQVLDAANDYFASEDLVGQWIDERCHLGLKAKETSAALFKSWKSWTEDRGFVCGTQKTLGEALRARDFFSGKVGRERGWHGIALARVPYDVEVAS